MQSLIDKMKPMQLRYSLHNDISLLIAQKKITEREIYQLNKLIMSDLYDDLLFAEQIINQLAI